MRNQSLTRRQAGKLVGGGAVAGFLDGSQSTAPAPAATADEICFLTAVEMVRRIGRKELSAREIMAAHLKQIGRVNPKVNAIVTLVAEHALEQARRADEAMARGQRLGPLHGLPVAHKDLQDTRGIRTTYGSPIYKDHVPDHDTLLVQRIRQAGAITVGKTNTPEFGAGSQTFNPVFGPTLNPYDLSRTCGGSSGGAAVALACGMVPIADGSDTGGSLRNPASFSNVVGLRTAPGRVPHWPAASAWNSLSVLGPMGRTVADVALFLAAIAGPDPRSPLAIAESPARFLGPLGRDFKNVRIAWCRDLGGLPFDPVIKKVVDGHRSTFERLGCVTEDAEPDFTGVDDVFKVFRALNFALQHGENVRQHRALVKDTIIQEVERGTALTGSQLAEAEIRRTQLYHRVRSFMEQYEFLALPVTQVSPFDVRQPYVTQIQGVQMRTYIDWMKSCYYISVVSNPALSVPCGFTPEGLPVGLQIVGRHWDEWGVLQLAHALEQATEVWKRKPPVATSAG